MILISVVSSHCRYGTDDSGSGGDGAGDADEPVSGH
jgi:hypothetical protein